MDRKLTIDEIQQSTIFKEFKYLDLIPYSIAILMVIGEIYIFSSFVSISHNLIMFAK